jgi:hypothetical protein
MKVKRMQVISTRTHGILDYLTAGFALAFPRLLRCSDEFTNAVTVLALGKLGYSMLTKHELGLVKVIPMKAHLAMDAVGGATMAALPFLTDEDDPRAVACAVGMGLFDIVAAPLTQTEDVERESPLASEDAPWFGGNDTPVDARDWRVDRAGGPAAVLVVSGL